MQLNRILKQSKRAKIRLFSFQRRQQKQGRKMLKQSKEFKEPKIKVEEKQSKAKAVLYELIRDGTVPMEKDAAAMSIDDFYLLHLTLPFTTRGNF